MKAVWWNRLAFTLIGCSLGLASYSVTDNFARGRMVGVLVNGFSFGVSAAALSVMLWVRKQMQRDQREREERMAVIDKAVREFDEYDQRIKKLQGIVPEERS